MLECLKHSSMVQRGRGERVEVTQKGVNLWATEFNLSKEWGAYMRLVRVNAMVVG